MPFSGRPAQTTCTNASWVLIGPLGFSDSDEVRGDGGAQHVFAVTAGAIEIVLLPAVVGRLIDGVPRRLVVLVAQRRVGGCGLRRRRCRPARWQPGYQPPPGQHVSGAGFEAVSLGPVGRGVRLRGPAVGGAGSARRRWLGWFAAARRGSAPLAAGRRSQRRRRGRGVGCRIAPAGVGRSRRARLSATAAPSVPAPGRLARLAAARGEEDRSAVRPAAADRRRASIPSSCKTTLMILDFLSVWGPVRGQVHPSQRPRAGCRDL